MALRDFPNNYFAWYNDDKRLAIVARDTTSTDTSERTTEPYDSWQGDGDLSGTITNMTTDGSTVTVTCSAAHSLVTNDRITISGTALYDGNYALTAAATTTTFTFSSSEVAATADTISGLSVSSGTATATTSVAHGYSIGDVVYIDAANNTYDEQVTIVSVADSTHFTYTTSEGDISTTGVVGDTGSFTSLFINDGLRITYHSKYEDVTTGNLTSELSSTHGVDTGMQNALLCYVKARLYEDQGDIQKAQYFRAMYNKQIKQYPSRKSGVRQLSVPRL